DVAATRLDLPIPEMNPGEAMENDRPFISRHADGVVLLFLRMRVGLAIPLAGEHLFQISPGAVELVLEIVARVLPVPHPRDCPAVARVDCPHDHPEVVGRSRSLQTGASDFRGCRDPWVQPPPVRRSPV